MLSEISQRERDPQILYIFTYMWNLQKQKTETDLELQRTN